MTVAPRIDLPFRRASADDFEAVYAIIADAALWLQSRNIPQWEWFLSEKGKKLVRHRIESAETYLVFDSQSQPIATFTIQWEDPQIWGSRGSDGTAGYVHGLAVCRRAAGKGLGLDLLALASNLIAENSRRVVRLDCHPQNQALCNYYRRAGFSDLGTGHSASSGWSFQLFERPIDPSFPDPQKT